MTAQSEGTAGGAAGFNQDPGQFDHLSRDEVVAHMRALMNGWLRARLFPNGEADAVTTVTTYYSRSEAPRPGYGAAPHYDDRADWSQTVMTQASGRQIAVTSGWTDLDSPEGPYPFASFFGYDGEGTVTEYCFDGIGWQSGDQASIGDDPERFFEERRGHLGTPVEVITFEPAA